MKRFSFLALAITLLVASLAGCLQPRHGKAYCFPVDPTVTYLTEELAMAKAQAMMANKGYDLQKWHVSKSDAGREPDKFINRLHSDVNQARILFTNGKKYREVEVRLEGNQVVCCMFYGL